MKKSPKHKPARQSPEKTWWYTDAIESLLGIKTPEDRQAFFDLTDWSALGSRYSPNAPELFGDLTRAVAAHDPEPLLRIGRAGALLKRLSGLGDMDQWRLAIYCASTELFSQWAGGATVDTAWIKRRAQEIHQSRNGHLYLNNRKTSSVGEPNWTRLFKEMGLEGIPASKGGRRKSEPRQK